MSSVEEAKTTKKKRKNTSDAAKSFERVKDLLPPAHELLATIKPHVGRPSKYDPRFCEMVLTAAERRLSLTAFAGWVGVSRDTISEWMSVHPEFSYACKLHASARTYALENGLFTAESGPQIAAHIFALKNAAPQEWRDKQQVDVNVNLTIADLVRESYAVDLGEVRMLPKPE